MGMLGIEPRAARYGSKYANYCPMLPPPLNGAAV